MGISLGKRREEKREKEKHCFNFPSLAFNYARLGHPKRDNWVIYTEIMGADAILSCYSIGYVWA